MHRWLRSTLVSVALLLPALAIPDGWAPDSYRVRIWTESQALTRAAPTATATDGMSLDRVINIYVILCPNNGSTTACDATKTLSGGGEIDFYSYDQAVNTSWRVASSDTVWTLTACAGMAACISPVYSGGVMRGRILAAAKSVTTSAGAAVTVVIVAQTSDRSEIMNYAQP